MQHVLLLFRKAGIRLQPRGHLPAVRSEGNSEAHVPFRHGQVLRRGILRQFRRRLRMQRVLVIELFRVRVNQPEFFALISLRFLLIHTSQSNPVLLQS
jgi:hypothetical protein